MEFTKGCVKTKSAGRVDRPATKRTIMKDKIFSLYGYSSGTDGTYFSGPRVFTQNKDFRTEEQYRYYRECGLNTLLLEGNDPYYGETWATSQTKKNMDTAYKAGIDKIIVYDKRIFDCSEVRGGLIGEGKRFATCAELESFIERCIKDYKNHPAFYGIMLVDEPRWFQIEALAQVVKAIKTVAPEIFIHNNILPFYPGHGSLFLEDYDGTTIDDEAVAYRKYVANYLDATGMQYLTYDSYPMRLEPEAGYFIRREHLQGLQIAAEEVKKRNIEFYFVCQTQAFYAHDKIVYRAPNEAEMRWQVNCVLAFGIKSIGYFTYWRKQRNSDLEYFVDGTSFMTQSGEKTPLYFAMQKIHSELKEISDYLLDLKYESSGYYSDLPVPQEHIEPMEKGDIERFLDIKGDGKTSLAITRLVNEINGEKVICIFNADDPRGKYAGARNISVKLKQGEIARTFSLKNGFGAAQNEFTLDSGDSVFLVVK